MVFIPFCGRGTAVFESLIRGRQGDGCDINPVAACVAGAKCDPPAHSDLLERLSALEKEGLSFQASANVGELADFFSL